jgi:hypothetical protein
MAAAKKKVAKAGGVSAKSEHLSKASNENVGGSESRRNNRNGIENGSMAGSRNGKYGIGGGENSEMAAASAPAKAARYQQHRKAESVAVRAKGQWRKWRGENKETKMWRSASMANSESGGVKHQWHQRSSKMSA